VACSPRRTLSSASQLALFADFLEGAPIPPSGGGGRESLDHLITNLSTLNEPASAGDGVRPATRAARHKAHHTQPTAAAAAASGPWQCTARLQQRLCDGAAGVAVSRTSIISCWEGIAVLDCRGGASMGPRMVGQLDVQAPGRWKQLAVCLVRVSG